MARSSLLSFIPCTLQVTGVIPEADHVTIKAKPLPTAAECPTCKIASQRVHSFYRRVLRDLPWQGRPVTIHLAARRFRCSNRICPRQTFAERLTEVATVSGRRTGRLRDLQRHLALALGGQAGARLAVRLSVPTSPDTLLRLATAQPINKPSSPTLRVVGIDDWAWRRGRRYGTILVDLERNEVLDLLPDREAATVATWLRDHPGVQIVARDRAGAYADGIRQGAPEAVQVADRWHLLRNLGDAVQALTEKYSVAAARAAQHVRDNLCGSVESVPTCHAPGPLRLPSAAQRASEASRVRRQARYEEVARLRTAGVSISRIAADLGTERQTVRRWLRLGHAPLWEQPPSPSVLEPFIGFLERRWNEGCHNAAQLWRELIALGFRGRPTIVRRWAGKHRQ